MSNPRRTNLRLSAFVLFFSSPALACGPFFPNQLLLGSDDTLLSAPAADFAHELARLHIQPAVPFKPLLPADNQTVYEQSAAVDVADLRETLAQSDLTPAARARLLTEYSAARDAIAKYCSALQSVSNRVPRPILRVTLPAGLPAEFSLYAAGLIAYHEGRTDDARVAWEKLLALPADQCRNRATWAAYMLGKSYLAGDPARAIRCFQLTRELVKSGHRDSLGLAASSIGWEARAELNRRHFTDALSLYLTEYALGSSTAIYSVNFAIHAAFADNTPDALRSLAADPTHRRAVAAYLVATGVGAIRIQSADSADVERWLATLESANARDVDGADRLAWAAYNAGLFPLASRWCDRAPADAPLANWIRSKLLLRAGKTDDAMTALAKAAASFPASESWPVRTDSGDATPEVPADHTRAELGALQLARGRYTESLDLLLRAGWWADAAHVAERVVTLDELKTYVDQHWPSSVTPANPTGSPDTETGWDGHHPSPDTTAATLRHLLARRLTRAGRWDDARPYYPPALQPRFDAYVTSLRAGLDPAQSASARAASLWAAAQIARYEGMDLLATELDPDNHLYAGNFPAAVLPQSRTTPSLLAAPDAEIMRVILSAPSPNNRFHYRYTAASHAYAAAQLLPNDTDEKALILTTAGLWLAARDPISADRFYKTLVRTCRHTSLGQRADAKRWFPSTAPSSH